MGLIISEIESLLPIGTIHITLLRHFDSIKPTVQSLRSHELNEYTASFIKYQFILGRWNKGILARITSE